MAEPYLQAMEHSTFHSKAVLRKRAQKRALGAIEAEYNFHPPQPVLSCRTVNIDLNGTRTYRAKSAGDIIDEQHRLIHQVYMAHTARGLRSAPQKRQQNRKSREDGKHIRFLSVTNTPSSNAATRPQSQMSTKSKSSAATSKSSKSRSSTPGSQWRDSPQHLVPGIGVMHLSIDPELKEKNEQYKQTNTQLKHRWSRPSENDCYSQALTGTGLSALNPKSGNQWLSFAGSQKEKSEGVVDSFTVMKDEYFSIDGTTGSHVAKQLNKGDKIRIGVNGQEPFLTRRKRNETKESKQRKKGSRDISPPEIVPLCWTDQVSRPTAKVVETKSPRTPPTPMNYCETHPVIFKKLIDMDYLAAGRGRGGALGGTKVTYIGLDGFKIKARHKTTQNTNITNVTIDQRSEDSDDDLDAISVDDILDRKLGHRRKEQRSPYGEATVTAFRGDSADGVRAKGVDIDAPETTPRKYDDGDENRRSSNASGVDVTSPSGGTKTTRSRPMTAHSAASIDPNIEALCVVPNGENNVNLRKDFRQTSGKRPPPAKPSLHKSSAATGASVGNSHQGEASYIQIVQPLDIAPDSQQHESESPTMNVIQSVKQYNEMSSNHSIPPPSSPVEATPRDGAPNDHPVRSMSPTKELLAKAEPTPNAKYAFNIPTAEMLSDSTSMFSDHDTVMSEEHGDAAKTFALSKPRQTPVQEEDNEDDITPRTDDPHSKANDVTTQIIDSTST